jgi:hypothetical protein
MQDGMALHHFQGGFMKFGKTIMYSVLSYVAYAVGRKLVDKAMATPAATPHIEAMSDSAI